VEIEGEINGCASSRPQSTNVVESGWKITTKLDIVLNIFQIGAITVNRRSVNKDRWLGIIAEREGEINGRASSRPTINQRR
jgi:hypothetical protein